MFFNVLVTILLNLLMSQVGTRVWFNKNANKHFYIFPENERPVNTNIYASQALASYYLLFNDLIPLDLPVTLIFIKLFCGLIIEADV